VVSSTKASGSPGPTIAGVLVVAALAAGGGFYAWRRRESRGHAG
jgi:LPXTG-motif cell wall-anchored protein